MKRQPRRPSSPSSRPPGLTEDVPYDFLINATGPQLSFDKTPGLGPGGNSLSVCTPDHATQTSAALDESIERMSRGEKLRFLVGMGHGACTCEGAAFEYVFNLEFELRNGGVRDNAEIIWITNESELGDFGVDGLHIQRGGYVVSSSMFAESLFVERGVDWILGAHVCQVDDKQVTYETLDGAQRELAFDFAMLLPPFTGVGLRAVDSRRGHHVQALRPERLHAGRRQLHLEALRRVGPGDWPKSYQSPATQTSSRSASRSRRPTRSRSPAGPGTVRSSPPRPRAPGCRRGYGPHRGAQHRGHDPQGAEPHAHASMGEMGAACVASAGASLFWRGSAVSMTMYPVVPDYKRYPQSGETSCTRSARSARRTLDQAVHHIFIYKAKLRPGWAMIPE